MGHPLYIRISKSMLMAGSIRFYKYQGTGNDFILIDDRENNFDAQPARIASMCDRHFGIGADGLMLLRRADGVDFEMVYYNSDGSSATFCGNGGRCMAAFARLLGIVDSSTRFAAPDGLHTAEILSENGNETLVRLGMNNAMVYEHSGNYTYLNTGTWHTVFFTDDISQPGLLEKAPQIRFDPKYEPHGTNVNFVSRRGNILKVRTYEKGVEGETLSCGTGVTASAIAASLEGGGHHFIVKTPGGQLEVDFKVSDGHFSQIYLQGPVSLVFTGEYNLNRV